MYQYRPTPFILKNANQELNPAPNATNPSPTKTISSISSHAKESKKNPFPFRPLEPTNSTCSNKEESLNNNNPLSSITNPEIKSIDPATKPSPVTRSSQSIRQSIEKKNTMLFQQFHKKNSLSRIIIINLPVNKSNTVKRGGRRRESKEEM